MDSALNKYFEVRGTKNGKGLFAIKTIPANTALIQIWGKIISFEQTLKMGTAESFCLQIDYKKYIATHFPFFLCNHSCNPNCAINSDLQIFALKAIGKNEELRWDYSTSMLEKHWTMQCSCGAKNCRKIITDFDLLPLNIQTKYLQLGIVMPFIASTLNDRKKNSG